MLTLMTSAALVLAAQAAPTAAPTVSAEETTIPFAAGGGIRNFEAGPAGSNIVYLQSRTLRWYRVTLSGPCLPDRTLQTLTFRTDVNGTFDRFSQIGSTRYPNRVCAVNSVVRSDPPPGQPGANKAAKTKK